MNSFAVQVKIASVGMAIDRKSDAVKQLRTSTNSNPSSYERELETLGTEHTAQEGRFKALRANFPPNSRYGAELRAVYRAMEGLERRVNAIPATPPSSIDETERESGLGVFCGHAWMYGWMGWHRSRVHRRICSTGSITSPLC